jgi:hypothetical protein
METHCVLCDLGTGFKHSSECQASKCVKQGTVGLILTQNMLWDVHLFGCHIKHFHDFAISSKLRRISVPCASLSVHYIEKCAHARSTKRCCKARIIKDADSPAILRKWISVSGHFHASAALPTVRFAEKLGWPGCSGWNSPYQLRESNPMYPARSQTF